MNPKRIGGIVLAIVGLAIAYTGYEMSQSIGGQVGQAFTGSSSDGVIWRYVVGAACVAGGAVLAK